MVEKYDTIYKQRKWYIVQQTYMHSQLESHSYIFQLYNPSISLCATPLRFTLNITPLRPGDANGRQRTGSSSVQVMVDAMW